jgi:hypothetical protein
VAACIVVFVLFINKSHTDVAASIASVKASVEVGGAPLAAWTEVSGVVARVRRGPVGVNLMLA